MPLPGLSGSRSCRSCSTARAAIQGLRRQRVWARGAHGCSPSPPRRRPSISPQLHSMSEAARQHGASSGKACQLSGKRRAQAGQPFGGVGSRGLWSFAAKSSAHHHQLRATLQQKTSARKQRRQLLCRAAASDFWELSRSISQSASTRACIQHERAPQRPGHIGTAPSASSQRPAAARGRVLRGGVQGLHARPRDLVRQGVGTVGAVKGSGLEHAAAEGSKAAREQRQGAVHCMRVHLIYQVSRCRLTCRPRAACRGGTQR